MAIYNLYYIVTVALLSNPTGSNNVPLLLATLYGSPFFVASFNTSVGCAGDYMLLLKINLATDIQQVCDY